ncbi:hypothetical protein A6046_02385 [[Haemophilus] ducreyi]|uniref:HTH HARE-type domain-containing protein n=2 Tax=Haemophilus ducreyi TaxID=730 RepID=Q7VK97_HAEDU|nr:sigma factor-like helix-turn-helix DNA-binding protein [[Haemophilus] ducreyi]AAP96736.1 hypothetical protein HD_2030 [[Haemophilus] ducreyi 35000HP]AKO31559.1 hypothetical protein RY60_07860 [[Haemophilus] ducreyi]AKO33016.1 hypothetical protein RZ57_07940 [[Haemophilus] ducreyi]AKO34462.1 hypothetical protein RZ58_07930 [[Haemophilus] ducreyi]AKO35906.1 hypothetical protein RZ59_07855 [[Haemophilus] ducreyi]
MLLCVDMAKMAKNQAMINTALLEVEVDWQDIFDFEPLVTSFFIQQGVQNVRELLKLTYQQLYFEPSFSAETLFKTFTQINQYLIHHFPVTLFTLFYPPIFAEREVKLTLKYFTDLPVRTLNLIKKQPINTVKQALDFIFSDLATCKGISQKTVIHSQIEAIRHIQFYSNLSTPDFDKLIFQDVIFIAPQPSLIDHFKQVITLFFTQVYQSKHKERDRQILFRRYGLETHSIETLEHIGHSLGLTRERVRQISNMLEEQLQLFLRGEYRINKPATKRLDNSVIDYYYQITQKLTQHHLITCSQFPEFFQEQHYSLLLMHILGYQQIYRQLHHYHFKDYFFTNLAKDQLDYILENIQRALYDEFKDIQLETVLDYFDTLAIDFLSVTELCLLLDNLVGIRLERGKIHREINTYRNFGDIVYRLLLEKQQPTSLKAIAHLMIEKMGALRDEERLVRSIASQMSQDPRFSPMGKSGVWTLTEWHIANKNIKTLIVESLTKYGLLSQQQLFELIKQQRKVSMNSIKIYLSEAEFVCEDKLWRLRRPNEPLILKTKRKLPNNQQFYQLILTFFNDNDQQITPLTELINYLASQTDYKASSIRQKLKQFNGNVLEYLTPDINNNVFVQLKAGEHSLVAFHQDLRHQIQQHIREILAELSQPLTKGELYQYVLARINCIKQTFYAYLAEMSDIEQYKQGSKYYVCAKKRSNAE